MLSVFLIYSVNYVILLVMVLISIMFVTLLERKLLSLFQDRKGPNKISVGGVFQPLTDGVKLLLKEVFWLYKSNFILYIVSPVMSMSLMMLCWNIHFSMVSVFSSNNLELLFLLGVLSMGVYGVLLAGWSSNSLYSYLGSLRSIAQTISYEVSLIFLMIFQFILVGSISILYLLKFQVYFMFFFILFMIFFLVLLVVTAEMNRAPFDLVEGESELVSGFNIEYFSGLFALIFLAEYGMILFFSLYMVMTNFGILEVSMILYFCVMFMILGLRGVLPRVRYDKLMYMVWKGILPVSMNMLLMIFSMKLFLGVILV
uniref:NADH-ubiquinone oxidoreductase chain 1 n=1 Tax=Parevania sp. ZJUH_2016024 TaxID=2491165 RepID=A0A3Q8UA71_9HYME|nr:NADH dehydrogenase subunit 1 [Parevania sp. ZJUH_2016024]